MSEKPNEKTASAPKRHRDWLILGLLTALIIVILGVLILMITSKGGSGCIYIADRTGFDEANESSERISDPHLDCLSLERVSSPEDLARGLSGRESLPQNQGMLFEFPEPGMHCLWMKDMRISIDMIWLDENKKVINLERNVSPDTYPENFCPDKPALYAIEVNPGVSNKTYISPGSVLSF